MPQRVRKLVGTVILVAFVIFYALAAMTIGAARLPGMSGATQFLYYLVAGLAWVIPAGVLIAWDWRLGLAALVVWITMAVVSRYSSLSSLTAALFAPAAAWYLMGGSGPYFIATVVMSVVLVARHHQNIRKLLRGEESRIGEKRKPAPGAAP